tara:strand:+ start:314 stop:520 length:207 start_codon:yes stop_codon:yes gene_type:complete
MSNNNFKSGYEIRESLIGMSIGINQERVHREFENEHLKPEGQRNPVEPYTVDQVIQTAETLYQFVTKK